jgi:hypothetical protein
MRVVAGTKLEKHVPVPACQTHGRWLSVLLAMSVTTEQTIGESFLVKNTDVARCVHGCARQRGMKVRTAKQSDGLVRIWRVK